MKNNFGKYLKSLRKDREMTLRDVEKQAKISNAYLSQVERGERNIPTLKILARLAKVYGVPISDLTEKAEKELQKNEKKSENKTPAPDKEFIFRGYEKLSEGDKQSLKNFLQYLRSKEKNK